MRIEWEFVGGKLDRQRLASGSPPDNEFEAVDFARAYYLLTDGGRPGNQFWILHDPELRTGLRSAAPRQWYRVTDRAEGSDQVVLRAVFLTETQSGGSRKLAACSPAEEGLT